MFPFLLSFYHLEWVFLLKITLLLFLLYHLISKKYVPKRRPHPVKSRKNCVRPFWRLGRLDRFLDSVCMSYRYCLRYKDSVIPSLTFPALSFTYLINSFVIMCGIWYIYQCISKEPTNKLGLIITYFSQSLTGT